MLIDTLELFSDDQVITVDAISTNVIDLLPGPILGATANVQRDIGAGQPLYLFVLVTTAMDSAGEAATLQVTLESDSTANLATSATVHWDSGTILEATMDPAGYWIAKGIPLPPGNYERYLGIRYNNATEAFTTGKISAWISDSRFDTRTYRTGSVSGIN